MSTSVLTRSDVREFPLFKRGKVRDVYDLGDRLLVVATDRVSAFDAVLPTGIPGKGAVLTRMAAFWFGLAAPLAPHHLLSTDPADLPAGLDRSHPELRDRFMLVRKVRPFPVECVVRGYLAGSAWKEYREKGTVSGVRLPAGLRESERLPEPLFTPTTKAETGHDETLGPGGLEAIVGGETAEFLRRKTLEIYAMARSHAEGRGILIADTKLEWGEKDGERVLIDEIFTPDSSRFWPADRYEAGKPQPSFDKQYLRDWLEASGWDKNPPAPELPPDVVAMTASKYEEAMRRLTGGPSEAAGSERKAHGAKGRGSPGKKGGGKRRT
ncbi:MAG: phosphoribosylaminoimidazolesuccinocarboxamide synthase [Planctomycetes bacterium]|nr:phosphoribosylaminoimidazolesuccinocarboxamide synthase [Planctomycetota bacterium]